LDDLAQEVRALHRAHYVRPEFGVKFTVEKEMSSLAELAIPRVDEDVEIVDDDADMGAVAAYYSTELDSEQAGEGGGLDIDDPDSSLLPLDAKLGLAMEPIPGQGNMESLWRII